LRGRKIVFLQREIIERLKVLGRNTSDAERVLESFEQSLKIFEQHVAALTPPPRNLNRRITRKPLNEWRIAHAERAHVGERHRRAGRVFGVHFF